MSNDNETTTYHLTHTGWRYGEPDDGLFLADVAVVRFHEATYGPKTTYTVQVSVKSYPDMVEAIARYGAFPSSMKEVAHHYGFNVCKTTQPKG